MDLSEPSDRERLVVEQALTTCRALERAASDAPYGQADHARVGHPRHCGQSLPGDGPSARSWADERRAHLLNFDGVGLIRRLEAERDAEGAPPRRAAIRGLLGYLGENRDSMGYRDRPARGLPIGSGLVEGACKNIIHARLRLNSARWRIRRAERIGALRCLDYSGQWDAYWAARAA